MNMKLQNFIFIIFFRYSILKSSRKNFNLFKKIECYMKSDWDLTLSSNIKILLKSIEFIFLRYEFFPLNI